jgi:hypothetical protein
MVEGALDEFAHRMFFAGGKHIVVGLVLLEHHPHPFHIVAGMTPITLGIQVAEKKPILYAELDGRNRTGDLAGDERLAAGRAFVVERQSPACGL